MDVAVVQNGDAVTRLLVDYLYELYPDYEKYKDKTWTREGALDQTVKIYGKSLREILTSPNTLLSNQDEKNIIVFRGDREGDGKEFYLHKLIETCYEVIPHFVWEDFEKFKRDNLQFRYPIIIDRATMDQILTMDKINIAELAEICFMTQLQLKNEDQKTAAKEVSDYLARNGMLALFVGAGICEDPLGFITTRLKPLPDSVTLLPALILFADRNFASELSEGEEFYCIDIPPLSDEEIMRYIAIEVPECSEILRSIKRKPEALEILRKQERLLKQVQRWKRPTYDKRSYETNVLEVEVNYICDLIDEVLNSHNEDDKNSLRKCLYEAAEMELRGKTIPEETLKKMCGTDCFNSRNQFTFAHCRYFLVAEKCYNESSVKKRYSPEQLKETLKTILLNWPIEVQYYFAEIFLNEKKRSGRQKMFCNYWSDLCDVLKDPEVRNIHVPASVLVKTMVFTNMVSINHKLYVQWAVDALKNKNYDEMVLAGLSELSRRYGDDKTEIDDKVQADLLEEYRNAIVPEVQRRIVYFYSRAGYIIPHEIVDTLSDYTSSKHLRYHIVSALIETSDVKDADVMEYYEEGLLSKWVENCSLNDEILQCEFETLYYRRVGTFHEKQKPTSDRINGLIKILRVGEYWEKAHAAGALCRLEGLDSAHIRQIISQFFILLKDEFEALKTDAEQNRLKTVSYVTEALCKLIDPLDGCERTRLCNLAQDRIAKVLSEYIDIIVKYDVPQEVYDNLNSALLLLACALVYFDNPKLPLRKLLGAQFSPGSRLVDLLKTSSVGDPNDLVPENDYTLPDKLHSWIKRQDDKVLPWPNVTAIVSKKYAISVGRISVDNKQLGMGFMIRMESGPSIRVYCITCRHLFDNLGLISEQSAIALNPLAPNDRTLCYKLEPVYPLTFSKKSDEQSTSYKDEITIFRVFGVHCDIVNHIFGFNDFASSNDLLNIDSEGVQLFSYGYPQKDRIPFVENNGTQMYYKSDRNTKEICIFKCEHFPEYLSDIEVNYYCNGFSGTPIVDSEDRIISMHNANIDKSIIGIRADLIKECLKKETEEVL